MDKSTRNRILKRLVDNGIDLVKGFLGRQEALDLSRRTGELIRDVSKIDRPLDLAGLPPELANTSGQERAERKIDTASMRIATDVLARGPEAYRDRVKMVSVRYPFVELPDLADTFFSEEILELASSYLGASARVSWIKLKRSFPNNLPSFDDNHFHVDDNADKILKIIIYLNDVVDETDGPHAYIRKSHREKFGGWDRGNHYTDESIFEHYPQSAFSRVFGHAGDAIFVDTKGFHKETKATRQERTALLVNYVLEEEYGGRQGRQKIPSSVINRFTSRQREAAQFLDVV